jgi:ribosomal 30S subunit maturation factor RimM
VIGGTAGEWLLPATRVHIRRIDLATGRIELDPAADLAGLAAAEAQGETGSESV